MPKRFTSDLQAIHFVERPEHDISVDTTLGVIYIPHDHLSEDCIAAVDYLVKQGYDPLPLAKNTPWEPTQDV